MTPDISGALCSETNCYVFTPQTFASLLSQALFLLQILRRVRDPEGVEGMQEGRQLQHPERRWVHPTCGTHPYTFHPNHRFGVGLVINGSGRGHIFPVRLMKSGIFHAPGRPPDKGLLQCTHKKIHFSAFFFLFFRVRITRGRMRGMCVCVCVRRRFRFVRVYVM